LVLLSSGVVVKDKSELADQTDRLAEAIPALPRKVEEKYVPLLLRMAAGIRGTIPGSGE
jgi:hypothetical protein